MRNKWIFLMGLLIGLTSGLPAVAQTENQEINRWIQGSSGVSIRYDSLHSGQRGPCFKIEPGGKFSRKFFVDPLSVLQFSAFTKSINGEGFSFLEFYDSSGNAILRYEDTILSPKFKETGFYTLAPPRSLYVLAGIQTGPSSNLVAEGVEVKLNIGKTTAQLQPTCNLEEYLRPFWKGDTVIDESVLLYSIGGAAAEGSLLFQPDNIISVKSFDLQTQFHPGTDFLLKGNHLIRQPGSTMSFRTDSSFDHTTNLAWFNTQSQWVVVSYTHHGSWREGLPKYEGNLMPRTLERLRKKQPLRIVAYGMSITRGMDVSGYDSCPPYLPPYADLFTREIGKAYGNHHVHLFNEGLPGAWVSWGANYAEKYITPLQPDLVIIDFGMNDFWRYRPDEFKQYVNTIMQKVRSGNPLAEFLLLANMDFDPAYVLDNDPNKSFYRSNMLGYSRVLRDLEHPGCICLDMTSLSGLLYKRKKAKDFLANPLHPNDYMTRWYAQCMTALFVR